jgi:hypothetical protein
MQFLMNSIQTILLHKLTQIAPDQPNVSHMTHNLHVITLIGLDPSAVRVTLTAPDPQENDPWVLLQNGGFCNGCITERCLHN